MTKFDRVIIGAGFYGIYLANLFGAAGMRTLVLEYEEQPFSRATYINQARVHLGYHYPRSMSTAAKSAGYFDRFMDDYGFCVHRDFDKIYAIASDFTWTDGRQFTSFCKRLGIRCEPIHTGEYFKAGRCEAAFRTCEYTYDAMILRDALLQDLKRNSAVTLLCQARLKGIIQKNSKFIVTFENHDVVETSYIVNATYASVNQILALLGYPLFPIKYELCEIILCSVSDHLKDVGITVMDGPFFSIMPFGKTGLHSLTSVTFTPHLTSYSPMPTFPCQAESRQHCSPDQLGNCNDCPARPKSAWPYMSNLAQKFLRTDCYFSYEKSLFTIKPILIASEIDDSRPTVIRRFSEKPTFISVLSGKINTIYDLEDLVQ